MDRAKVSFSLKGNETMTKRYFFCLLLTLLCAVNALAQTRRNRPPRKQPAAARRRSAVGILYGVGAGQRITSCFLKTPDGVIEFSTTDRTRTGGFNDGERAWSLGAQWQVIYHEITDRALGAGADSVSFTGRVEQSIADAVGQHQLRARGGLFFRDPLAGGANVAIAGEEWQHLRRLRFIGSNKRRSLGCISHCESSLCVVT